MFQLAVTTKEDYLKQVRKFSISIKKTKNVQVEKFLFEIILNKQYDQLISKNKDLNKDNFRVLIYGHDLPNTATALNVFYAFLFFYISNVRIEELVDQSNDQQEAFRQILQCMRFIRNMIHLNDKRVSNVARFYNYQINIQENGFGKSIFFDIFWLDKEYHLDYLKYPQQLISLINKVEEINKDGIFIMALDQQFLYEKDNIDTPVLFNFLYSQREQDDYQKNLYGWQIENQDNQNVYQTKLLDEVDLIKAYLRKVLKQFNEENDANQLKQIVLELIDKEEQFLTIKSMINHLTFRKIEIIQNSTIYSDRPDINQFCQIVYQLFVPLDPDLHDIIQKFLISTRRYKIESGELNNDSLWLLCESQKSQFLGKRLCLKNSKISYSDIPQYGYIDHLKSRLNEINIMSQIEDHKIPYILQNIHIGFMFKQEEDISRIEIYNLTPIYRPFSIIQESNDLKQKIQFAEKIAVCLKIIGKQQYFSLECITRQFSC